MAANKIISMQDSLLEHIVINFRGVFYDKVKEVSTSRKKLLPPNLFERILHKRKELMWNINQEYLTHLLPYRDILDWKSINLFTIPLCEYWGDNIFALMNQVTYPLKYLSVFLYELTDEGKRELCVLGPTIESLKLHCNVDSNEIISECLSAAHFPNLKKLYLIAYPAKTLKIDFTQFSNTLEELILEGQELPDSSFKSLTSLTKLRVLSFKEVWLDYNGFFLEILRSLKQLRTLVLIDLPPIESIHPGLLLQLPKMHNLENCDVSFQYFMTQEHMGELMKCKNWKRFGAIRFEEPWETYDEVVQLNPFIDEIFLLNVESLLPTCEAHIQESHCNHDVVRKFLELIPQIPSELTSRIENVLLELFARYPFHFPKILSYVKSGRCTQNFIRKLINIISTYCDVDKSFYYNSRLFDDHKVIDSFILHPPVARLLRDIVRKDLNKCLVKKLLHCIFFIAHDYLSTYVATLGLENVYARASSNNLVEDEDLVAVKRLLEHIAGS